MDLRMSDAELRLAGKGGVVVEEVDAVVPTELQTAGGKLEELRSKL